MPRRTLALFFMENPMGWMRYLLLGDYGQQLDIEDMRERLDQLTHEKASAGMTPDRQIAALQQEVHDLKLRLGVLIRLLIAKNVLSAEEIASMRNRMEASRPGRDLKRGFGGIADIEFLVQLLQLKYAGDRPDLRRALSNA